METGASKLRERLPLQLKSPARDARGRDVWPLLHRSLREMKWDRQRQKDYQRLVFGSPRRMWLIVIAQIVLLCGVTGGVSGVLFTALLRAMNTGTPLPVSAKSIVLMQIGLVASAAGMALGFNWWYLRRNAKRRIMPQLLAEQRCAACTYGLQNATSASDGCTLCSECGSAWRLPAIS